MKAFIHGSPLWVDGKIYLVTEEGDAWIFSDGKKKQAAKQIEMGSPAYATPVFANGVLYIARDDRLLAIAEKR